jgi:carbamate kinase
MGPKVAAACDFVTKSGGIAGIGRLQDTRAILEGMAGTRILPDPAESRLTAVYAAQS